MDVYDYAIAMEKDAEAYYRKLADVTRMQGIKKIFLDLADDERRHRQVFTVLKERAAASVLDTALLDEAKNLFSRMLKEKVDVTELRENLQAYQHALQLEAKAAGFYREMIQKESDAAVRTELEKIVRQEYNHFRIVENLYHFVDAPNQYLAWQEFSNIDEFHQFGRDVDL